MNCKTCSKKTELPDSEKCNNCWEVEKRITAYLESTCGREHVRRLLNEAVFSALDARARILSKQPTE